MAIELPQQQIERIREHGQETYPNECCGVLLGKEQDGRKVVLEILPLKNARDDSPRNRFLILPEDILHSDREARRRGLEIVGFYHSHPDHPARPSEFDREHAWPWYTYLILAVEKGHAKELTAWLLSDGRSFFPEEMRVTGEGNTQQISTTPSGGSSAATT
ncbi:MAG: M67 family metallopeptidase [bacterium]|nr:M67 family metallopeptidase [bacterium]